MLYVRSMLEVIQNPDLKNMFDPGSATVSMSTKATMQFFVTSLDVLVKCAQSIGKVFMLSSCYTQHLVFSSPESLPLDQASGVC